MSPPNLTTTSHTGEEIDGMDAAARERQNEIEALTGVENYEDSTSNGELDGAEPRPRAKPELEEVVENAAPMSPGDAARAAIAARFKRTDGAPFDGDMTKDENLYGEVARVTETPDPEEPEPGVTANAPEQSVVPERTHEVTIRGVKKTLTDSQLLDHAMRVEAGDSYLAETRALLQAAKDVKAGRVATDSQRPEDGQQQDDGQDDTPPAPRRPGDKRKEVVERIQFGDPDEAAQALAEYVGETVKEAIDEGQVTRLKNNDLVASQRALKDFIAANPKLAASKEASQLIENGVYEVYREELIGLGLSDEVIPRNPRDIAEWARHYRVQGHAVSDAPTVLNKAKERVVKVLNPALLGEPAPKPRTASPVVEVNVNRTQRREQIQNQPSRGVAPKANPTQAEQPKSRSDVVNEMRRSRGQPVA